MVTNKQNIIIFLKYLKLNLQFDLTINKATVIAMFLINQGITNFIMVIIIITKANFNLKSQNKFKKHLSHIFFQLFI
jgi:hypothetical protein